MKTLLFLLLRLSMIPAIVREVIQRRRVTIILYHDIDSRKAWEHLSVLKSKYNIISLKDYVEARKSGMTGNLPPKALIVTFDDGHCGNSALGAVVEKMGVPITVFICSGIVGTNRHFWFKHDTGLRNEDLKRLPDQERLRTLEERGFVETQDWDERQALSEEEVLQLKDVIDFQSHTMLHPCLPRCSRERADQEIVQSKADLEKRFGLDIYALSYPNGDYSDREIEAAKAAGYECGITVDVGLNTDKTDLFRLKRICINDDADISELLVRACGLWPYVKKLVKGQSYGYDDEALLGQRRHC